MTKKLQDVPIVGKTYHFFDDGKIKPSRHSIATILRLVSPDDAKNIMVQSLCLGHVSLWEMWKDETEQCDWLYEKDVDEICKRAFPPSPNSKKINQYDLQGNFIKTWNSAAEAHETIGVNISSLSECCNGKRKKAMGFIWKFKD